MHNVKPPKAWAHVLYVIREQWSAMLVRRPISRQMQDRSEESKIMLRLLPGTLDPGIRSPWAYLDRPEGQSSGPETSNMTLHLLPDGRDPETQT